MIAPSGSPRAPAAKGRRAPHGPVRSSIAIVSLSYRRKCRGAPTYQVRHRKTTARTGLMKAPAWCDARDSAILH